MPIIPDTYNGIVFDPSGTALYVSGGPSDNVHIFALGASTGTWAEAQGSPLALGHVKGGLGLGVLPCAAGVAISNDGQTLVVVNYYNDSITVFAGGLGNWSKKADPDLRPARAVPPNLGFQAANIRFGWVVKGSGATAIAYVSSVRDREMDVVNLAQRRPVRSGLDSAGIPA